MREQHGFFAHIDWMLVCIYLVLVTFGWMSIYAAVYDETHKAIYDLQCDYGKQAIFIVISLVVALIILLLDAKFFSSLAWIFYILAILMIFSVFFIGTSISGAQAWIKIGQFSLQPGELAKAATSLALAKLLSTYQLLAKKNKNLLWAMALILFPAAIIILQNDTGTALVYFALFIVLYREGMSRWIIVIPLCIIFLAVLTLVFGEWITSILFVVPLIIIFFLRVLAKKKKIKKTLIITMIALITGIGFIFSVNRVFTTVLSDYQQSRVKVLLGIEKDLKKAGYNVHQSLIAIGSGGFNGKGFLQGTQTKYNFVPEQHTDFIFCTVGEEKGFVGSTIVICLFMLLIWRIIRDAERQRLHFVRIYGYCVASILAFHIIINIGMVLGLMPVIGIPLPFFSYGGSSLLSFTVLLFIFIKLDANRLSLL